MSILGIGLFQEKNYDPTPTSSMPSEDVYSYLNSVKLMSHFPIEHVKWCATIVQKYANGRDYSNAHGNMVMG